MFPDYWM